MSALPQLTEAEQAAWAAEAAGANEVEEDNDLEAIAEKDPEAAADVVSQTDEEGDGDTEEEQRWRQERKVPFKAFDGQRHKIKALESEKAQMAAEIARFNERFGAIQHMLQTRQAQAAQAQQLPAGEAPKPQMTLQERTELLKKKASDESIWDAFEGALDLVKEVSEQTSQVQQTIAQQAERQQFVSVVLEAENQARQNVPDYDDAVRYARDLRVKELMFHGFNQAQATAQLDREVEQFLRQAMKRGQHPAQAVYEYAKVRGYQPRSADQQSQEQSSDRPRNAQGQFLPQNQQPDPKIKQMAESQQRHKSLSSANGSNGGADKASELSVDKLLRMSDADFAAWVSADKDGSKRLKVMTA